MCGRVTSRYTWSELVRLYKLTGTPPASNFEPGYNIAPTQNSFVLRLTDGRRDLVEMRWGLSEEQRAFLVRRIMESWKPKGDGKWLETFTILTTAPNAFMAPLHSRMPVMLSPVAASAPNPAISGKTIVA